MNQKFSSVTIQLEYDWKTETWNAKSEDGETVLNGVSIGWTAHEAAEKLRKQCIIPEVLTFIKRFPEELRQSFLSGNCYYFAVILADRFNFGMIWYDVTQGHFVYGSDGLYFDAGGVFEAGSDVLRSWIQMPEYDAAQYDRIIRDCVM